MKKIAFVMPKLGGGGAERVISTIIKYIDKEKFKCYLILYEGNGDYEDAIPKSVKILILRRKGIINTSFELIQLIRKINPDIVFSSLRTISALLCILKLFFPSNTKLVIRENNTPSESIRESRYPYIWKIIYKVLFRRLETIICQSDYMVNDFINKFNFKGDNLIRIYNPVDISTIRSKSNESNSPFPEKEYKNVVAIGKMTRQKGFDLLLKSFAEHKNKNKHIHLWLIGEGEQLNEYQNLSSMLGINDQVHFVGRQNNPFVWIKHADLFVLPSRYEGLPNVLLEAISCNCPVVVTEHPGGTKEVMKIINSEERIVDLDWDNEWFKDFKFNKDNFIDCFDVHSIIKEYEAVFNDKLRGPCLKK